MVAFTVCAYFASCVARFTRNRCCADNSTVQVKMLPRYGDFFAVNFLKHFPFLTFSPGGS